LPSRLERHAWQANTRAASECVPPHPLDEALLPQPVGDQIRDRDHRQGMR
jgi:hypothetical protein